MTFLAAKLITIPVLAPVFTTVTRCQPVPFAW
jgi:hypothetical protein